MKLIFSIISCCFFCAGFSQSWRKINQSELNIKYKLPTTWEVDGFGGYFDNWEEGGSSVCTCGGTINFGPDRTLGMVIYPTKSNSDMTLREYVWDYHFVPTTSVQTVTAKKISFQRVISKWELTNGSDEYMGMLDDVVWQLTAKTENYGFIMYFWGDASIMLANEKTIYKILDSIVQVKK